MSNLLKIKKIRSNTYFDTTLLRYIFLPAVTLDVVINLFIYFVMFTSAVLPSIFYLIYTKYGARCEPDQLIETLKKVPPKIPL